MLRICPLAPARIARDSIGKCVRTSDARRDGRILRGSTDQQTAVVARFDIGREPGHVDQRIWLLDCLAHQIDEVGASAEILRVDGRRLDSRIAADVSSARA